ncbi:MAG: WYL domain-containing protein [Solirubrobacterales bacterium]|nr:WYL domain-containing protein [Solirubrobacterales bacterium]
MVGMRAAASAAVQGIEDASLRALAKLDQVLSARLRRRVRAFDVLSSPAADVVEPALVAALTAAIGRRERIELRYRDREGARTRRLVDPHRVIAVHRRWYLLAFDTGHEDWRTFRWTESSASPTRRSLSANRRRPRIPWSSSLAACTHLTTYAAVLDTTSTPAQARRRLGSSAAKVKPRGDHCRVITAPDTISWLARPLTTRP